MRGIAGLVAAIVVSGLGCQEEPELPPPPIAMGTGPVVPPVGGQGPGDDANDGSTLDASGTLDGTTTLDASGTFDGTATTAGTGTLLAGRLLDGPAGVEPVTCYVRIHLLDSLDPGSGLPLDSVVEQPVEVLGLPQAYAIDSASVDAVGAGDTVYVSATCDVDGDGALDSVGAWYPDLPLQPVDLPASGIDMALDVVF